MREVRIAAVRGRAKGDWYTSDHHQTLEIGGGEYSHSLTHVAKDNYIVEMEVLRYPRGDFSGGRIETDVCPTLSCSHWEHNNMIVENMNDKTEMNTRPEGKGWVYDEKKGVWFRVRKFTPRECFRLMDVDEDKIDRLMERQTNPKTGKEEQIISNSQLYKMAGNSIVVNPMYLTFERFLFPEMGDHNIGDQLTLF